jgi:hypothetical protein
MRGNSHPITRWYGSRQAALKLALLNGSVIERCGLPLEARSIGE